MQRPKRSNLWPAFLARSRRSQEATPISLLCLDPGETTGWALFRHGRLTGAGQFRVTSPAVFDKIIDQFAPSRLVVENYRVYPWRSKQQQWSDIPTLQYIGMIKHVAALRGIPVSLQMAQLAKVFCTDSKLKMWGLYKVDRKHANDAIRHGCYFLIFGRNDQLAPHKRRRISP